MAKKDVVETVTNANFMTLLISKIGKLQLVTPVGRRGVITITKRVYFMLSTEPKPIKLEGKILDRGIVLQGQN